MTTQSDISTQTQITKPRWLLLSFILVLTVLFKVMPYALYRLMNIDIEQEFGIYPWGFSPMFAVCLFGGAIYRSRVTSLWIPMAVWLAGDFLILVIAGDFRTAFYPNQPVVYVSFLVCAAMGFVLRSNRSVGRIAGAGLTSCLLFFLLTNFGSWLSLSVYEPTFAGLMNCYAAGLPFLRNSLISTAIFSCVLFSPICMREVNAELTAVESESELASASAV